MKAPFLPNTTKFPAPTNFRIEVKGLKMSAIWNVWLSCVEPSSETVSSLLAEVRDACSVGMTGHTVQGPTRFHKVLRRHAGWSHIIGGSTLFSSRAFKRNLAQPGLGECQIPPATSSDNVKTPDTVHLIDLVTARPRFMTSSACSLPWPGCECLPWSKAFLMSWYARDSNKLDLPKLGSICREVSSGLQLVLSRKLRPWHTPVHLTGPFTQVELQVMDEHAKRLSAFHVPLCQIWLKPHQREEQLAFRGNHLGKGLHADCSLAGPTMIPSNVLMSFHLFVPRVQVAPRVRGHTTLAPARFMPRVSSPHVFANGIRQAKWSPWEWEGGRGGEGGGSEGACPRLLPFRPKSLGIFRVFSKTLKLWRVLVLANKPD